MLAVFLLIPLIFLVDGSVKAAEYVVKTKDYKILIWGSILSIVEVGLLLIKWKVIDGSLSVFGWLEFLWYFIILAGVVSVILRKFSNKKLQKISLIISASIGILFILWIFSILIRFDAATFLNLEYKY